VPDWNALVRDHFSELQLPPDEREEVITELAGYLEQYYESELEKGVSEADAMARAMAELGSGRKLAREISRAKRGGENMSDSMKQFWVPALASLAAFHLLWTAIQLAGVRISFFDLGIATVPVYVPLVLVMPLVGALGAYLSLRAGGSQQARLAAGLFPAIPLAMAYPLARALNSIFHFAPHTAPPTLTGITADLFMFTLIAVFGLILLSGVLPFLRASKS
jgi:hypothetical protein